MGKQEFKLFSQKLTIAKENEVPQKIRDAINILRTNYKTNPNVFRSGQYLIASIEIAINLPNQGTVDEIDIRETEPILICFNTETFPYEAPKVRPDRLDFPFKKLPHINPVAVGEQPSLCLFRGSINEWYAEHSLIDLTQLAVNWLQDAAKKKLIKLDEGDRFEETRIDADQWLGMSIFEYQKFCAYITEEWKSNPAGGIAFTVSEITVDFEVWETVKIYSKTIVSTYQNSYGIVKESPNKNSSTVGLLLWADSSNIESDYIGHLPHTYDELFEFAQGFGIDLKTHLTAIMNQNQTRFRLICPVYLCIKRPARLIHQDTNLEIISFLMLRLENGKEKVFALYHREPLNSILARYLSNQMELSSKIMLLGCGALGSKIGLHLGRAGVSNLTLVDNDHLSPHNLVRHALFSNSDGKPKAQSLKEEITHLYFEDEKSILVQSENKNALSILNPTEIENTHKQNFIIDATASKSVLNFLIEQPFSQSPTMFRCEITDGGHLGIALIEGRGRSPNLDDLEAGLYDLAIDDQIISQWLVKSAQNQLSGFEDGFEDITVGLGCNSPTMKLADDIVSFHAASQTMIIKKVISGSQIDAGIFISMIDEQTGFTSCSSFYKIEKYKTLPNGDTSGWKFRIKESLVNELTQKTISAAPNETGGILIGRINLRRKTVHITRVLDAPPDSEGYPYSFKMGVKDIPDHVVDIYKKTGHQIYYVGEWHSHPQGGRVMSSQDLTAMRQIKTQMSKNGLPTIIMIVTPTHCFPNLYI